MIRVAGEDARESSIRRQRRVCTAIASEKGDRAAGGKEEVIRQRRKIWGRAGNLQAWGRDQESMIRRATGHVARDRKSMRRGPSLVGDLNLPATDGRLRARGREQLNELLGSVEIGEQLADGPEVEARPRGTGEHCRRAAQGGEVKQGSGFAEGSFCVHKW